MEKDMSKFQEFKEVHSELMENTVSTVKIIEELNDVTRKLEDSVDLEDRKNHIKQFYKNTANWQILVSQPNEVLVWMQIPMKYYETKKRFSFKERLEVLFRNGVWLQPEITERYADMISNTKYPMEMILDPIDFILAKHDEVEKFYSSAVFLIGRILSILTETKSNRVAVYEKPHGIVAMNRSRHWIEQLGKETGVDTSHIQNTLETVPFSSLLLTSEMKILAPEGLKERIEGERDKLIKAHEENQEGDIRIRA